MKYIDKQAPVQGPYSQLELDFILENYNKMTIGEISLHLQRSYRSVQQKTFKMCRSLLLADNRSWAPRKFTEEEDRIIRINAGKLTLVQVATQLDRHPKVVYLRAASLGISYCKVGEDSPNAKLSNEDIELIRELYDAGLNSVQIAEKFEISSYHVRRTVNFQKRMYLNTADLNASISRQSSAIDNQN